MRWKVGWGNTKVGPADTYLGSQVARVAQQLCQEHVALLVCVVLECIPLTQASLLQLSKQHLVLHADGVEVLLRSGVLEENGVVVADLVYDAGLGGVWGLGFRLRVKA